MPNALYSFPVQDMVRLRAVLVQRASFAKPSARPTVVWDDDVDIDINAIGPTDRELAELSVRFAAPQEWYEE
ncbi:MAG TPA: hypothetical protein PJ982_13420 [Lacipirellulaceae bacterium]|nr:hypothetical protein [Lacipirellulaceae bacterium]